MFWRARAYIGRGMQELAITDGGRMRVFNLCGGAQSGGAGTGAMAVLQTASFAIFTTDTEPAGLHMLAASPSPCTAPVQCTRTQPAPLCTATTRRLGDVTDVHGCPRGFAVFVFLPAAIAACA